jgi:hypothetical protein
MRACDVENLADFYRYYSNSWVGWHPSDSPHISPVVVGPIERGNININLRQLGKTAKGGYTLSDYFQTTWAKLIEHTEFGRPDIGMLKDGPTILFASYTTPRSPHKGFRVRELTLENFNSWDIRSQYTTGVKTTDRYEWIWDVFNPLYPKFGDAYEELQNGKKVGVALSRTLGIFTQAKASKPLLAYKRWTLGYVDNAKTVVIHRMYEDYAAEIKRQTGVEVQVAA